MQCADDDEVTSPKKPKHNSGVKPGSTSLHTSDCERKITARLKELKGKARSMSLKFCSVL